MLPFTYDQCSIDAIEQIRLLTLFPSGRTSSNDQIDISVKCSLESVYLAKKPTYIALSYTWGNATPLKTILIDGKSFGVTVNLHHALSHLQQEEPVRLWIDAICINQGNNIEKNEQVKMMGDIYKVATKVFAWLGPAADDSDLAMDTLGSLGRDAINAGILDIRRDVNAKLWDPDPQGLLTSIRQPIVDLSKTIGFDLPHTAIKSLTERGYWTRTWIVQEFSLANDLVIVCGSKRLPVVQFMAAYLFIGMNRVIIGKSVSAIDVMDPVRGPPLISFFQTAHSGAPSKMVGSRRRYKQQTADHHSSMMELLILFSTSLKATDPRDKIYGFLGLAPDYQKLNIQVDYDKSPHEVFTDAARALLQHNYTDILAWCQFPKDQPNLPSWVPDFSSTFREPYGSYKCRQLMEPLFSASGSRDVHISPENSIKESSTITMSGLTLDTINERGSVLENDDPQVVTLFLNEIARYCTQAQRAPRPISQAPQFWSEALWRIPCADQEFHAAGRRRAELAAQSGFHEMIARYNNETSAYEDPVRTAAFTGYHTALQYLYGLRPFISMHGYVGLAPKHALPGDKICVIFGAIVPFVLRKMPGKGFELMGEAYVHGVMDGEAMDMGLNEEDFCLC